jgi:hypothetical protein
VIEFNNPVVVDGAHKKGIIVGCVWYLLWSCISFEGGHLSRITRIDLGIRIGR